MRTRVITPLLLGASALLLSACGPIHSVTLGHPGHRRVHHDHGHGHGPPHHAPAHGHRRKWAQHRHHRVERASGIEMVFDGDLGVYVVVDMPDHYYWDGWYLRIEDGGWYASADLHGGHWEPRVESKLPPGLAKKRARHHKRKHHRDRSKGHPGKGKGPAKPGW